MKMFRRPLLHSFLVIISCSLVFCSNSYCQGINSYISQVKLDSIEKTVRELSGEDSVIINDNIVLIRDRGETNDNELAAEYIKQRLQGYGLDIYEQNYSNSGSNIIATQQGIGETDSVIIICAHYDAVTTYCADDNASGCAAVLEAARVLSPDDFEHTIKYILFDEEEIGLVGSQAYVNMINWTPQNIISVINAEMLGYESKNPGTGYDGEFDLLCNCLTSNPFGQI